MGAGAAMTDGRPDKAPDRLRSPAPSLPVTGSAASHRPSADRVRFTLLHDASRWPRPAEAAGRWHGAAAVGVRAMPSDFALKSMNALHRVAIAASFGKLGWQASGMPVLELTTIGRKSGQPRSVMLTSPWQEGDTVVIVASRGGDDTHPAWFLNLEADPQVEVSLKGGPKQPMLATVADADERARLWPLLTKDHKNYAGYQTKTDREIPVVLLEPEGLEFDRPARSTSVDVPRPGPTFVPEHLAQHGLLHLARRGAGHDVDHPQLLRPLLAGQPGLGQH